MKTNTTLFYANFLKRKIDKLLIGVGLPVSLPAICANLPNKISRHKLKRFRNVDYLYSQIVNFH